VPSIIVTSTNVPTASAYSTVLYTNSASTITSVLISAVSMSTTESISASIPPSKGRPGQAIELH
jgi:hypothetical protein